MPRFIELIIVLMLLLITMPLMFLISLGIWMSGGGPIIFSQQRVGKSGKLFVLYKFRTMVVGSDAMACVANSELLKPRLDARITGLGFWLRRFSLDELPQLINVIRGEMALVGPRPHLPAELAIYEEQHFQRLTVKPGITGLWQVSGRSEKTLSEQLELDLKYIADRGLMLDILIVVKTLPAVLFGRGAY